MVCGAATDLPLNARTLVARDCSLEVVGAMAFRHFLWPVAFVCKTCCKQKNSVVMSNK